jgi:hypothetical protein
LNGVLPYAGRFSAAPANDAAAGTEFTGNGYQRQAAMFGAPATDTGNVRKIANTNNISFGLALAALAQAVAFGIFDAQSSGALHYWDLLPIPKTVEEDDHGQFAPGALFVKED